MCADILRDTSDSARSGGWVRGRNIDSGSGLYPRPMLVALDSAEYGSRERGRARVRLRQRTDEGEGSL